MAHTLCLTLFVAYTPCSSRHERPARTSNESSGLSQEARANADMRNRARPVKSSSCCGVACAVRVSRVGGVYGNSSVYCMVPYSFCGLFDCLGDGIAVVCDATRRGLDGQHPCWLALVVLSVEVHCVYI